MRRLRALFSAIVAEAERNPAFQEQLEDALGLSAQTADQKRPHRRRPGILDPFSAYTTLGEDALRRQLEPLDLEQLKDIVAENGMDTTKLAMKWRQPERVIDLIVDTVRNRSHKGDAFRTGLSGEATRPTENPRPGD